MNITILTDNPKIWVMSYKKNLRKKLGKYQVRPILNSDDILEGDLMLILFCERILRKNI